MSGKDIVDQLGNLNIGSNATVNGSGKDAKPSKNKSVWQARSTASVGTSNAESNAIDSAGESEAWPAPSAERVNAPSTNSCKDHPKRRGDIKWVATDFTFGNENSSGRGGSRHSQGSFTTNQGCNSFRGRGRGYGRHGMSDGPNSTRGQARNLNNGTRRPRQSNGFAENTSEDPPTVNAASTSAKQENVPRSVSVSAAAVSARGSHRGRGRRGGINSGASNVNRNQNPIQNSSLVADHTLQTGGHGLFISPVIPVSRGVSVNSQNSETEPVVPQVNSDSLYINTTSTNISTQSIPSSSRPELTIQEFANVVRSHPEPVTLAGAFRSVPGLDEVVQFSNDKNDENFNSKNVLITIGEQIFLFLQYQGKFLKFDNRHDFINHHINHYFSEKNLKIDNFLRSIILDNGGVCPFDRLLMFNRLKSVNTEVSDLIQCASPMNNVEVKYNEEDQPIGYRILVPLPSENSGQSTNPGVTSQVPTLNLNPSITSAPINNNFPADFPHDLQVAYPFHNSFPNPVPVQAIPPNFPNNTWSDVNYPPDVLPGYGWSANIQPPTPTVTYMFAPNAFPPPQRLSFVPQVPMASNAVPPVVYVPTPYGMVGARPTAYNSAVVRPPVGLDNHSGNNETSNQEGNSELGN